MKKVVYTIVIFFLILLTAEAQVSLSLYSGVGRSSFDKNIFGNSLASAADFSQAEYIPLGARLTFNLPVLFTFGAEVNYAVAPFTFDVSADVNGQNMKVAELKVHQLLAGVFIKARLLPGPIVPYAKVGAGLISGNVDLNWTDQIKQLASQAGIALQDSSISIKNAVGVNIGGGVEINLSESGGLFGEIVYYFVQREEDIKGAQSFQANSYAFLVGWQFNF
jgi:opacity protein-like surface antigen